MKRRNFLARLAALPALLTWPTSRDPRSEPNVTA